MKQPKHVIAGVKFNSDKDAQLYAKEILYADVENSILRGDDLVFMLDYFGQLHCEWQQKKGVGIQAIRRVKDMVYVKYRAFQIERTDGSKTDISYIISNIRKNDERDFKAALRWIIEPQIWEFKQSAFANKYVLYCPVSGLELRIDTCHADHESPTFEDIVADFIKTRNITNFAGLVMPTIDNEFKCELIDKKLEADFYQYHKQIAKLRLLSPNANLTRKRK